jgi:hypothetical protein
MCVFAGLLLAWSTTAAPTHTRCGAAPKSTSSARAIIFFLVCATNLVSATSTYSSSSSYASYSSSSSPSGGSSQSEGSSTLSKGNGYCWQAHTPDHPTCSGYASVGYTCVGDYCSAIDPGGTPSFCAKFVPGADAVDPLTGNCTGTSGPTTRFAGERVAQEALYNATDGAHWSDSLTNKWLGPCHCQWVGVTCLTKQSCDNSPVYQVNRQSKNLTGVLPSWNGDPGQGALPQLQVLLLFSNPGLTGTLPETYEKMPDMQQLNLYVDWHSKHKTTLTTTLL